MKESTQNLKKILMLCLNEGGKILLRGFGKKQRITKKGSVNIVTETDKAAERKIISVILKYFPKHGILAEESTPITRPGEYRWIIDPLDGTTNFAHNIPLCCVSKQSSLIDSLLVTGFPYDRQEKAAYYLRFFRTAMENTQGLRRLGAAALDLAYVACGRFEAFWEFNLKPWDIAAGTLIVQEAGGKVTDLLGQAVNLDAPAQLLAANSRVHSPLLNIFKKNLNTP